MIKFLVSFKHRHPGLWSVVEGVNGFLFRLRYGKVENKIDPLLQDYGLDGCRFSLVREEDLPALERFLAAQEEETLKWFHPHAFDALTLKRLFKNPAFLMMMVSAPEGQAIIGYFFLRCFFIGRAFAGLIVEPAWQNRGIGSLIWHAEAAICQRCGLRMQATISTANKPSLASCRRGTSMTELQELEDGYLAVECKTKNHMTK